MAVKVLTTLFGSKNKRELKKMRKLVKQINQLEETMSGLTDEQLRQKTEEFKQRFTQGESLDQLLPEAFAVVRESSSRTLGLRHFDVQLIGGITLHQGKIAEMRTGEGKTLVSTLPAYLNALSGDAVHIVTVNDYLAQRDAAWMAPIYELLGMKVGVIGSGQHPQDKIAAYNSDIVYGTNNEFGFDYLRDNMALRLEDKAQGNLSFAIVDEVDSILIDEARTPLIISGAAQDSSELYRQINKLIPSLKGGTEENPGDFVIDEKMRQVELTEEGHGHIEQLLGKAGLLKEGESLYQATNLNLLHHVHSALRAHHLFHRDVEYIVQEGRIVLIDEHTGRTMSGRRLSEGLHQAIEAKEGLDIQSESQTVASTTFQNYFRLYDKLSGMTGTADTEAFEFQQIYGLQVVVIPTNVPVARQDLNDLIYLSHEEKLDAVVKDIIACQEKGAPVLVGTVSIEASEEMSRRLEKEKIQHRVLNAKFHEKEAEIIAQAGRPGTVTIATNMAGRGTDIVLGGSWEAEIKALENPSEAEIERIKAAWKERHKKVIEAGGLHILGTERHESRRIDNQLRGRAGRQGDPGVSRFYLSLDDPLMRLFASERVQNMMKSIGMDHGEAIEHRMVTNAIEKAQRKVEGRNFDIRKQLLEFDDVANDQRQVIYNQRNDLLEAEDISDIISEIRRDVIDNAVCGFVPPQSLEEMWDIPGLESYLNNEFGIKMPLQEMLDKDDRLNEDGLRESIQNHATELYEAKSASVGPQMKEVERQIMLQVLDTLWREHLSNMDHLRQGIYLRSYAGKNPKQEYKRESFDLFRTLLDNIKFDTVQFLMRVQVKEDDAAAVEQKQREQMARQSLQFQHDEVAAMESEAQTEQAPAKPTTYVREGRKVGRNDPCPCGSGKKFKQCHGALN